MAIRADRVGVRQDQVDVHGRVTSPSFLNELLESLPEWTDMPVRVNGTEELLPSNNSVPVTSPILADIAYPDIRRDNQYFTYRESPTPVDGLAKIKSIKGNTFVWNQLVQNGNFADTSNWTTEYNPTISASNNILSLTPTAQNGRISQKFTYTANHKLLIMADVKLSSTSGTLGYVTLSAYAIDNRAQTSTQHPIASTDWQKLYVFCYSASANTNNRFMFTDGRANDWGTTQIRNFMAFDLTSMFGESKANELFASEQSQVGKGLLEFTSLFPLPYYAYNQGSLLSFNGNGIKTVGFNQWDEEWEVGTISVNTGMNVNDSIRIRSKNYIHVLGGKQYYIHGARITYLEYDANKTFLRVGNSGSFLPTADTTFTPSADASYIRFYAVTSYGTTYNHDICINISNPSKNGTYEPYTSTTTSLPISTYFPTGMKSAGSVYDELTPRKAITRIGAVDLGSLTWAYDSTYNRFNTTLTSMKISASPRTNPNLVCPLYQTISDGRSVGNIPNMAIYQGSNYDLSVHNTSYTNANDFKQAMNGVYLYYELATPVELPTMSFE